MRCSGTVKPRYQYISCCDKEEYNSSTHMCCNDKVNPRGTSKKKNNACCDIIPYNSYREVCCNGRTFTKSSAY